MSIQHLSHQERVASGLGFDWDTLSSWVLSAKEAEPNATDLRLRRQGRSHKGIGGLKKLRRLFAYGVDQDFLDEISLLEQLETLHIEKLTAKNFSPLNNLSSLRYLIIDSSTTLEDLGWISSMQHLKGFALENCKSIHDLSPISTLTRLAALGVEGGTWKPMVVSSIKPISSLHQLEYLFMTNLRVEDKSLTALKDLKGLKAIQCANFFPEEQFADLSEHLPSTRCDWFPSGE